MYRATGSMSLVCPDLGFRSPWNLPSRHAFGSAWIVNPLNLTSAKPNPLIWDAMFAWARGILGIIGVIRGYIGVI